MSQVCGFLPQAVWYAGILGILHSVGSNSEAPPHITITIYLDPYNLPLFNVQEQLVLSLGELRLVSLVEARKVNGEGCLKAGAVHTSVSNNWSLNLRPRDFLTSWNV